ncbi:MAG TPA: hypothetical protein VMV92_17880 [Streptosporangiaceae bacterium]|nr:hypothetical protein [Streptosporangiaceae bacterium]
MTAVSGPGGPACGKMTWAQAVSGPLAGATCLWQDLDGLHVEPAPAAPPPASLMWGWRGHDHLVRLRLDGDTAYVAVHSPVNPPSAHAAAASRDVAGGAAGGGPGAARRTLPWALGDGRVAASRGRGPAAQAGGAGAVYEQIVVDGIAGGAGPITFVRPVNLPGPGGDADDGAGD